MLGKQTVSLHTLVAQGTSKLAFWLHSSNLSVQRATIAPLLHNPRSWSESGSLGLHWHVPSGPRHLLSMTESQRTSLKAAKYTEVVNKVLRQIDEPQQRGWVIVFTDGSSKRADGWDQAGYGCFYGHKHPRNVGDYVPEVEPQTNNRGGIRAVLCALEHKAESEQLVVVVDSEYVFDVLTKNLLRWERKFWRGTSGIVSQSDLWADILGHLRRHQQTVRFLWVPSHVGIVGNEGADCLAKQGRLSHPYNETRRAKRVAPDDQVFTRQDTDLPSHCSWVLSEYEGSMVEGGDEDSYHSSLSVHSVESS